MQVTLLHMRYALPRDGSILPSSGDHAHTSEVFEEEALSLPSPLLQGTPRVAQAAAEDFFVCNVLLCA
ncbi:hypothetical protein D3C86_1311290 [compost metagenome]